METLSKPVRMSPDMSRLLSNLRAGAEPYSVYQQPADEADQKVCDIGLALVTDANLDFTIRNAYMWYVRELARLLRTRYGWDLAFHLEMVMRKWQSLGLSPNIIQIITCEVHNALKPAEVIRPSFGSSSASPKPEERGAEGNTAKAAKSAKHENDEARNPNDESSPKSECPKAVSGERSAVGPSSVPNPRPQTPDPAPEAQIDASAGGLL